MEILPVTAVVETMIPENDGISVSSLAAVKIQQAWRRYHSRVVFCSLRSNLIAAVDVSGH